MQLITLINQIFAQNKTNGVSTKNLWLRPYEIVATSPGCGIIEFLPDTLSIDYIKRKMIEKGATGSLLDFYTLNFGSRTTSSFI